MEGKTLVFDPFYIFAAIAAISLGALAWEFFDPQARERRQAGREAAATF